MFLSDSCKFLIVVVVDHFEPNGTETWNTGCFGSPLNHHNLIALLLAVSISAVGFLLTHDFLIVESAPTITYTRYAIRFSRYTHKYIISVQIRSTKEDIRTRHESIRRSNLTLT